MLPHFKNKTPDQVDTSEPVYLSLFEVKFSLPESTILSNAISGVTFNESFIGNSICITFELNVVDNVIVPLNIIEELMRNKKKFDMDFNLLSKSNKIIGNKPFKSYKNCIVSTVHTSDVFDYGSNDIMKLDVYLIEETEKN